jgi:hypothetical protein
MVTFLFYFIFHILSSNLLLISQLRMPPDPQALLPPLLPRLLQLLPPMLAVIRSNGEALLLEVESTIPEVAPTTSLPQRMVI